MNVDAKLRAALERVDTYAPSPDLFARVTRTLEDDARHRRRVRRAVAAIVAGVAAAAGWFAMTGSLEGGRFVLPGWSLEVVVTVVMVALVAALGPLLRRVGVAYLAGALGSASSGRFAALLDLAYYLVCAGYVLLTLTVMPDVVGTPVDPAQLARASRRIGGLALLMGVLHTSTLLVLPIIGLLLRDIARRAPHVAGSAPAAPDTAIRAARSRVAAARGTADRIASLSMTAVVVALAAILGLIVVVVLVLGIG